MRVERVQMADDAKTIVGDAAYVFLVSYQGLTVEQVSAFRGELRDSGANCRVLKNTYIQLGLKQNDIEVPSSFELTGDTAVVYGQGDPVTVAKVLRDYTKKQEKVQVKAGVLEQNFLTPDEAKAVADMPSKEQIYAEIVFAISSPAQRIHRMVSANRERVVHLLQQYIQQNETE